MKNFIITDIDSKVGNKLITILNYEFKISNCIKKINLPSEKNKSIIIDALLYSGLNSYRFLEVKIGNNGKAVDFQYINPEPEVINIANNVVMEKESFVKNSILTNSQIRKIQLKCS